MTESTENDYLEVSPEQGALFFGSAPQNKPVVMLNLLRFRARADYHHAPELEPKGGLSGAEAYRLYMEGIEPLLRASGGELLFAGTAHAFLIGPHGEHWDYAMLVKQTSASSFMAFASDPMAQKVTQHRTAAVADSRLLPIWPDLSFGSK